MHNNASKSEAHEKLSDMECDFWRTGAQRHISQDHNGKNAEEFGNFAALSFQFWALFFNILKVLPAVVGGAASKSFPVLSDAWEGDNLRFFLVFISYFHACKGAHGPFMCFHWFQPGYAPCGQIILASAFHISYNAASPPWAVEFSFAMCGQLIMGAMGFPAEKWTAHDVLPSKTSSKGPNASSSFSINSVSSNPYIGGKTVISFAKTSLRRSMS